MLVDDLVDRGKGLRLVLALRLAVVERQAASARGGLLVQPEHRCHQSVGWKHAGKTATCTKLTVDLELRLVPHQGMLDDRQTKPDATAVALAPAVDAKETLG